MSVPVHRRAARSTPLADRAFGACPIGSAVELPEPGGGLEIWWRAVALGAIGHYAAARSALGGLREFTADPVLLSLAASTEGSLLRQLGRHAQAAHFDGRAAALALPPLRSAHGAPVNVEAYREPAAAETHRASAPAETHRASAAAETHRAAAVPEGEQDHCGGGGYLSAPDLLDAAADALTGLAADALGAGRLTLATRLLDRCTALLDGFGVAATDVAVSGTATDVAVSGVAAGPGRPRARVRLHWVRAETALAGGDGARALVSAEAALALAARGPSRRHRVKSQLLVAVAAGVTGNAERSAELAAQVDRQCRALGLVPLRWACAMVRTGVSDTAVRAAAAADATACRALIARRGGHFHGTAG